MQEKIPKKAVIHQDRILKKDPNKVDKKDQIHELLIRASSQVKAL